MVKLSMRDNQVFGIDGYNLPRTDCARFKGIFTLFSKAKGKSFADTAAAPTKNFPGPGEYKTAIPWGCVFKKLEVTKKNTYID